MSRPKLFVFAKAHGLTKPRSGTDVYRVMEMDAPGMLALRSWDATIIDGADSELQEPFMHHYVLVRLLSRIPDRIRSPTIDSRPVD